MPEVRDVQDEVKNPTFQPFNPVPLLYCGF
jgi:hypothetical protein